MIHSIIPIKTYAGLPILLILLHITDFLRYKPIIVMGALASVVSWSLLIWGYDHTQLVEVKFTFIQI